MTRYTLCSYRKIRERDADGCAEDISLLLLKLKRINPEIFQWKSPALSKKKALASPYVDGDDLETIRELVGKGVNRRDDNKEIIKELGFLVSFWNGTTKPEKAATLSITNGGFSPVVSNSVVLVFPEFGDLGSNDELAEALVLAAVQPIDAESALLYRDQIDRPGDDVFLDRGAYLAKSFSYAGRAKLSHDADNSVDVGSGDIFLKHL